MAFNVVNSEMEPIKIESSNWRGKYFAWLKLITVEPTMWLYMMAFMTTSVVEQAFFVHKSCRVNHGFSQEICDNLSKNDTLQALVQVTVSEFHQWNNIVGHVVPIILALFFGNWSDRRGRKLPLIVGLIGKLVYSSMVVVNSMIDTWNLNMVIYTASLPMGMLGGDVAIFASCFAYISDVSSAEQRTLRVTILDIVYLSTMPIGIALGSYIYNNVVNHSYSIMFVINVSLLILSILYSWWKLEWQTTSRQQPLSGTNIFVDFFEKEHVIATVKTLVQRRRGYGRLHLWILMLAMALYTFQRDERSMSFLYTKFKFHWDVANFSQFRTFQSALFIIAMLLGVPLMTKVIGLRDTVIVAIGACAHAAGRVVFVFAEVPHMFYVGAAVAALGPIVAPVLRSMTSKVLPVQERGRVFAMLSVCDNAVPLFSSILYTQLYNATINTYRSSIYWLTFSTQIAVLLLILVIHISPGSRNLEHECPEENENCQIQNPSRSSTPEIIRPEN